MDIHDDQVSRSIAITMLGVIAITQQKKKKRNRRMWSKEWLINRDQYSHMVLLRELKDNNPDDYRNYLRMSEETFSELLVMVKPMLHKEDTVMRPSITPEQRLMATLRYLATGRSFEDLKFSTGISAQSLGRIIPETCKAIIHVLKDEYMKVCTT